MILPDMMTEHRKTLIEYRLTQARDSIREADVLGVRR